MYCPQTKADYCTCMEKDQKNTLGREYREFAEFGNMQSVGMALWYCRKEAKTAVYMLVLFNYEYIHS
jgi:hypothetical protein